MSRKIEFILVVVWFNSLNLNRLPRQFRYQKWLARPRVPFQGVGRPSDLYLAIWLPLRQSKDTATLAGIAWLWGAWRDSLAIKEPVCLNRREKFVPKSGESEGGFYPRNWHEKKKKACSSRLALLIMGTYWGISREPPTHSCCVALKSGSKPWIWGYYFSFTLLSTFGERRTIKGPAGHGEPGFLGHVPEAFFEPENRHWASDTGQKVWALLTFG